MKGNMMDTTKKHDWGLIVAGVLLLICGGIFAFAPIESLATLTIFAGAFLLVAGIFAIINYFRFRKSGNASGWTVFYGILEIILGLMFLVHPVIFAAVTAWVIGIFVVVLGVYEVIAAFRVKKFGSTIWGWILASGIVQILLGICFFVAPASLAIFIALFLLMHGINLIIVGWNVAKITYQ